MEDVTLVDLNMEQLWAAEVQSGNGEHLHNPYIRKNKIAF